jgi:hypothetical protein
MVQDPEVDGAGGVRQGADEVFIFRGRLGVPAEVFGNEDKVCRA